MPHDYPSEWKTIARKGGSFEEWIVVLEYGTGISGSGSNKFIAVSTVDGYFKEFDSQSNSARQRIYGVVKKVGNVSEEVDIETAVYKSNDVSVELINDTIVWNDDGAGDMTRRHISELFFGDLGLKFVNRKMSIFSRFGGDDANNHVSTNMACLYTGRIIDFSQSQDTVTIKSVSARPYDFRTIPDRISSKGMFYPVAYGDYQHEESTTSSPQTVDSAICFPLPIDQVSGDTGYALLPKGVSGNIRPHTYNTWTQVFCPIDLPDGETWASYGDVSYAYETLADGVQGYAARFRKDLKQVYNIVPETGVNTTLSSTSSTTGSDTDHWNTENSWNTMPYNRALNYGIGQRMSFDTQYTPDGHNNTYEKWWWLDIVVPPQIKGLVVTYDYYCQAAMTGDPAPDSRLKFYEYDNNPDDGDTNTVENFFSGTQTGTRTLTINKPARRAQFKWKMKMEPVSEWSVGVSGIYYGEVQIHGMTVYTFTESIDFDNEPTGAGSVQTQMPVVYCGADGKDKDYNGGSGAVIYMHEMFRDLLASQCDYDVTDAQCDGWSDLVTDRTQGDGWVCRYSLLEPEDVKSIIKKVGYEGGFAFKMRPKRPLFEAGDDAHSDSSCKFIHVKDMYNDESQYDHVIKPSDIVDGSLKIVTTGFESLKTFKEIKYDLNTATGVYKDEIIAKNSTSRTSYDIKTEENKENITLDALVKSVAVVDGSSNLTGSANAAFANYYDNISGDIKLLVSLETFNPVHFDMECGDIVRITPDDLGQALGVFPDALGKDWEALAFMVVKANRTIGSVKIQLREVFNSRIYVRCNDETFPPTNVVRGWSGRLSWYGGLGQYASDKWTIKLYKTVDSSATLVHTVNNVGTLSSEAQGSLLTGGGLWEYDFDLDTFLSAFTDDDMNQIHDDGTFQIRISSTGYDAVSPDTAYDFGGTPFNVKTGMAMVWPDDSLTSFPTTNSSNWMFRVVDSMGEGGTLRTYMSRHNWQIDFDDTDPNDKFHIQIYHWRESTETKYNETTIFGDGSTGQVADSVNGNTFTFNALQWSIGGEGTGTYNDSRYRATITNVTTSESYDTGYIFGPINLKTDVRTVKPESYDPDDYFDGSDTKKCKVMNIQDGVGMGTSSGGFDYDNLLDEECMHLGWKTDGLRTYLGWDNLKFEAELHKTGESYSTSRVCRIWNDSQTELDDDAYMTLTSDGVYNYDHWKTNTANTKSEFEDYLALPIRYQTHKYYLHFKWHDTNGQYTGLDKVSDGEGGFTEVGVGLQVGDDFYVKLVDDDDGLSVGEKRELFPTFFQTEPTTMQTFQHDATLNIRWEWKGLPFGASGGKDCRVKIMLKKKSDDSLIETISSGTYNDGILNVDLGSISYSWSSNTEVYLEYHLARWAGMIHGNSDGVGGTVDWSKNGDIWPYGWLKGGTFVIQDSGPPP